MSIVAISSRILRRRASIFSVRNVNHERPILRFRDPTSLVANSQRQDDYEREYIDEPIGVLGYLSLGIPIISFILGSWQVERRKWKLGLIDNINAKVSSTPISMPEDLSELEQLEYRPVKIRGEYLYDREFAIGPKSRIRDGAGASEKGGGSMGGRNHIGYYVITPFKLENRNTTVLINRGWVPSKLQELPKEKLGHVPGTVEITGIVRLNEERQVFMPRNTPSAGVWVHRDLKAMSYMAGTDPVFLDLIVSSAPSDGPIAGQTRISMRNEHLSYIITWYSLSIITAWMWHRLFIRKLPLL